MSLDISKVYGGVRLNPVLSAIDCILCFYSLIMIIVYYPLRVVSRRKSDITPYCYFKLPDVHRLFLLIQNLYTTKKFSPS